MKTSCELNRYMYHTKMEYEFYQREFDELIYKHLEREKYKMETQKEIEQIDVLDHGFVRLVDTMGSDNSVVQAARVSYGQGTKSISEDAGLIDHLLRHNHTTPFEMIDLKFHIKCPIFVARQWLRHRTASVNEVSGRYSEMPNEMYSPDLSRMQKQSTTNKQGSSSETFTTHEAESIKKAISLTGEVAYETYSKLLTAGLSRELCRVTLPLSLYTEFYWKIDGNNLMKFLQLRLDEHAQYEIRVFAEAMAILFKEKFPLVYSAFDRYVLNAVKFSKRESEILADLLNTIDIRAILELINNDTILGKREKQEFVSKLSLGDER